MSAARKLFGNPFENPVFRREILLFVRRGWFPWVLLVLTIAMTLVIAAVGGSTASNLRPSDIGRILFQTYFGIAHGIVMVAGPAIAASSIASEREGRTFELLTLTSLEPSRIARGKLLAAVGNVGSYVIALAPVGALTFLFGGVSWWSMLIAYGMLATTTFISVLFGLAISAWLPTTRTALITAVAGGMGLAVLSWGLIGKTAGDAVSQSLGVTSPGTFWLPVVVVEAHLPALQVMALLGVPFLIAALFGSLLFEVCVSNLSDPTADRTSRMKRWYAIASLLGSVACGGLVFAAKGATARATASVQAVTLFTIATVATAFLLQGDSVVAPRRVRMLWKSERAGWMRRFFGPGVSSTAMLQIVSAGIGYGVIILFSILATASDDPGPGSARFTVIALAIPMFLLTLFVVGLAAWLRTRMEAGTARLVLFITLLVIGVAPYAVSAILNDKSSSDSLMSLLSAPSPWFSVDLATRMVRDNVEGREVIAVLGIGTLYSVIGVIAITSASLRSDELIKKIDANVARVDELIAKEDAEGTSRVSRTSLAPKAPVEEPKAKAEPVAQVQENPATPAASHEEAKESCPVEPVVASAVESEPSPRASDDLNKTLPSGTPSSVVTGQSDNAEDKRN